MFLQTARSSKSGHEMSQKHKKDLKNTFARESKIHLKAVFKMYYVSILEFMLSELLIICRRHYVIYKNVCVQSTNETMSLKKIMYKYIHIYYAILIKVYVICYSTSDSTIYFCCYNSYYARNFDLLGSDKPQTEKQQLYSLL